VADESPSSLPDTGPSALWANGAAAPTEASRGAARGRFAVKLTRSQICHWNTLRF
jgi:hypothetical protein